MRNFQIQWWIFLTNYRVKSYFHEKEKEKDRRGIFYRLQVPSARSKLLRAKAIRFARKLSEKPARTKEHAGEKSRENGTRNSNSFETESHKFKYDRNDSLRLLLFSPSPPLLFAADLSRRDWRLFWNQRSRKKTVRQKESLKRKRERERERERT